MAKIDHKLLASKLKTLGVYAGPIKVSTKSDKDRITRLYRKYGSVSNGNWKAVKVPQTTRNELKSHGFKTGPNQTVIVRAEGAKNVKFNKKQNTLTWKATDGSVTKKRTIYLDRETDIEKIARAHPKARFGVSVAGQSDKLKITFWPDEALKYLQQLQQEKGLDGYIASVEVRPATTAEKTAHASSNKISTSKKSVRKRQGKNKP